METYRIDCFLIPRKHRLQEKKLSRESLVARGITMATVAKTHRVVVLGGGFGGLHATQCLKHVPVTVTLHRPAQFPSVSTVALSGRDRLAFARQHRGNFARHPQAP